MLGQLFQGFPGHAVDLLVGHLQQDLRQRPLHDEHHVVEDVLLGHLSLRARLSRLAFPARTLVAAAVVVVVVVDARFRGLGFEPRLLPLLLLLCGHPAFLQPASQLSFFFLLVFLFLVAVHRVELGPHLA